jgi:Mce-associated membrane protein
VTGTFINVGAVLAGTAVGVLGYRVRRDAAAERAGEDAVAAARVDAERILSYDHRHLDRDFAAARRHLAGAFAEDYARTTETVVRPTATRYQAVVRAVVVGSSVVDAEPDHVVVLLFVNRTTTSTRARNPQVQLDRIRMTLVRVEGEWRVSGLSTL